MLVDLIISQSNFASLTPELFNSNAYQNQTIAIGKAGIPILYVSFSCSTVHLVIMCTTNTALADRPLKRFGKWGFSVNLCLLQHTVWFHGRGAVSLVKETMTQFSSPALCSVEQRYQCEKLPKSSTWIFHRVLLLYGAGFWLLLRCI